jgi:hypothetical protein
MPDQSETIKRLERQLAAANRSILSLGLVARGVDPLVAYAVAGDHLDAVPHNERGIDQKELETALDEIKATIDPKYTSGEGDRFGDGRRAPVLMTRDEILDRKRGDLSFSGI